MTYTIKETNSGSYIDQREVFCAALQAVITGVAIKSEGRTLPKPQAAVEYARRVVRAAYDDNPEARLMDFTGIAETTVL